MEINVNGDTITVPVENKKEFENIIRTVLVNLSDVFCDRYILNFEIYPLANGNLKVCVEYPDDQTLSSDSYSYIVPILKFCSFEELKALKEQHERDMLEAQRQMRIENDRIAAEALREEELATLKRLKEKYPEEV